MYEPPRRLVYKISSAAEVLGYTLGSMRNIVKRKEIEAWPFGKAHARMRGRVAPMFYVIPYRAVRKSLEDRGASYMVHPEPVWKPIYTVAETMVLLDCGRQQFDLWAKARDLEVLKQQPSRSHKVTRLSIDALLERWEAGELSDLDVVRGELAEVRKAPQFRAPLETERAQCGWCGRWGKGSASVVVQGRVGRTRTPRVFPRRVCKRCVEKRIETVRGVIANGRPGWVDDAWVPWSTAADLLGVPYDGLQRSLQSSIKAGTVKMADFRAGGVLWTERLGRDEPVEPPEPSDEEWEPPDIEAALDDYEAG